MAKVTAKYQFQAQVTLLVVGLASLVGLLLPAFGLAEPPGEGDKAVTTVVIDPGHGGHDSGCQGSNSMEKHIVLDISLELGKYIQENFSDVQVVYTRKSDKFIPLHERTSIANKNDADVFISIHANATGTPSVFGTETFVMGLHRSKKNLKVAKRENSVITMEDNYKENYRGFDPNSPEGHIIFSLYQNANLDQSINLASKIEHQFKERANRKSRGVKQAGFLVLYKTTMPSVLIETGFLTNNRDEHYLMSEQGQTYTASAIYRAFRNYKQEMDKKVEAGNSKNDKPVEDENQATQVTASTETSIGTASASSVESGKSNNAKEETPAITFRVQIMASRKKLDVDHRRFKNLENVHVKETKQGKFKYMAGNHTDYQEAIDHQNELREQGFKGAWVVSYKDGQRIPLQDARTQLKNGSSK